MSLSAFRRRKASTGFSSFPSVHLAILIQQDDSRFEFSWIFTFWTCVKISVHVSFWVKIGQKFQPLHMKTCMISWCISVIGFHYFKQCALWRRGWDWRNCWRLRRYPKYRLWSINMSNSLRYWLCCFINLLLR